MKTLLTVVFVASCIVVGLAQDSGRVLTAGQANTMRVTDLAGANAQFIKVAMGTVTPSTGNGYSIDVSGVGFSTVLGCSVTPIKNTGTATSVPKIAIKSMSTSAVVVNIIEGNASTVNLLGSLVLLGTSEQFADVTGLTLRVIVFGI